MSRDTAMLQAIRAFYDAVLQPERWPQAFETLREAVGGDHVIFFVEDLRAGRIRFSTGVGVGPDFFRRLGVAAEARIVPPDFLAIPTNSVRRPFHFFTRDEFDRSPFYNEVVRPDGGFDGLLAAPFRENNHTSVLAIERLRVRPDYAPADAAMLAALLPHLANALQVRLKLEEAATRERQAHRAFDLLDFGALIVDAQARPAFVNRYADALLATSDGISIEKGSLYASDADAARALHRAIRSAATVADTRPRSEADAEEIACTAVRLSLPRPSRKPALVATVMPLAAGSADMLMAKRGRAIVFVTQPGEPVKLDAETVAVAFGLTQRQAVLAVQLARGASLAQAAAALGVALETARWHLKEIFERTNTHRQADLVRLLCSVFQATLGS